MPFWNRLFRKRGSANAPSQALREALAAFVEAETWSASQQIVEQHLELLGPQAGALLRGMEAQAAGGARARLEEHRELLERCRTTGIAQAFAEKRSMGSNAPGDVPPGLLLRLMEASAEGDTQEVEWILAAYPALRDGQVATDDQSAPDGGGDA